MPRDAYRKCPTHVVGISRLAGLTPRKCCLQAGGIWKSLLRLFLQAATNDRAEVGWNVVSELVERRNDISKVGRDHQAWRRPLERRLTGQHEVRGNSQTIKVASRVQVRQARRLLCRHVLWSTDDLVLLRER